MPKTISPAPIFKQMEALEEQKKKLEIQYNELKEAIGVHEKPVALKDYRLFLDAIQKLVSATPETAQLKSKVIK